MSPADYAALRKRHGSQKDMAPRLGISERQVQEIEGGAEGDPVPLKYELALRGYVAGLAFER